MMNYTAAHSPQWANEARTAINMMVTFDGIGEVPFSASAGDAEPHGVDLFQRAQAMEFGDIAEMTPQTLADLKAAKNQAINMARAAANSSFFLFQGKRIAVDQLSRSDIDAAHGSILMLQALPPGWPGGWKSMDNEIVPIPDVATWAQFYGTMVAAGMANFNHSQALKAQLAAASTPAEVDAVPEW